MDYSRERLGDLLVESGLITADDLTDALSAQARDGGKLGEVLVRQLIVTEDQLAAALAGQKGYEHVILTTYPVDHAATALIPERMARQRSILPIGFAQGKVLLAMVNPLDIEAVDDVEMRTGMRVQPVVVASSQLRHAIDKFITSSDAFQDIVESVEELSADEADTVAPIGGEDVPIVRLVNQLIREAVRAEASDIHIEPGSKRFVVRYRIDGVLNEIMELPMAAKPGVISRLKIMAEMDIAERRRPQDGRIALRVDDRPVDIRVASLPTPNGEALTLRILNSELTFRSIEDIGLSDAALKSLKCMIAKPFGALFISGPTGSGKSTTMYGALQLLNQTTAKIITVEDPIEYQMAGITQMAINPKIGLTFAAGLRTILRSDPDVVMVGEIRDPETAEIAVRAALTGHMVLSSIHTNDAPSALTRLNDMGVPPYVTSSSLIGVIAQRLVRKLCVHCRKELKVPGSRMLAAGFTPAEAKKVKIYGPCGCELCGQSGYKGRIGVYEIMPVDEEITVAFLEHAPAERLREIALANGMIPMRSDALDKVAAGITSLEEIDRVVF